MSTATTRHDNIACLSRTPQKKKKNTIVLLLLLLLLLTIMLLMMTIIMPSTGASTSSSSSSSSSSTSSTIIQELIERVGSISDTIGNNNNNNNIIQITSLLDQLQQQQQQQHQQEQEQFQQQQQQQQKQQRGLVQQKEAKVHVFGERCDSSEKKNTCIEQGLECTDISDSTTILFRGNNRCLPTTACLQEQLQQHYHTVFDIEQYKSKLYKTNTNNHNTSTKSINTMTEDTILQALTKAKNEREFIKSNEFRTLQQSLHSIAPEPLQAMQRMSRNCNITTKQDDGDTTDPGTVSYVGFHIEAGALLDGSLSYLIATNGVDQRTILRACFGGELGLGAEISYIFGFTNTPETSNLVCGSAFADLDLAPALAGGVAIGIGFNGVFTYEFTVGGGLGLGLGGGLCAGIEYGALNASTSVPTSPPTTPPTTSRPTNPPTTEPAHPPWKY